MLTSQYVAIAKAMYEAIEPLVIWRALFSDLRADSAGTAHDSAQLLQWILEFIPQEDEEIKCVHAPVVLHYMLNELPVSIQHKVAILLMGAALKC